MNTLRQTLQAGDIVRVYLAGNTSETSAKVPALGDRYGAHSFIVESNVGGVITVIDNWGDGRFIVRHNFEQIVDYYSSNGVFQAAFVSRIDPTYVAANNATYQSVRGAGYGDFSGIGATAVAGSVAISDVVISEGNSGTQIATFTVTRSGGTAAFAVNYATANNTATAGSDYVATSGTLNFAANVNTQTVQVTINGDTGVENHETFFVNLSGPTNGAIISDNQGQGTINNDDSAAAAQANLQVTNISAATSVVQGANLNFTYVAYNAGTAQAGAHYAGIRLDGQVTEGSYSLYNDVGVLAAGAQQTLTNSISTAGLSLGQHTLYIMEDFWYNGVTESNETDNVRSFTFNVTGTATAVAGSVSISDVVISEGNSGTQIATFTVTRSGGTAAFAVNYATANNTATAGSDYVATSGTLNFAANVNTQTVQVTINGDTGVENHETFFVNLSGPTNGAIISDNQGQGTINNDDSAAAAQANLQVTNISAIGSTYVRQGDDFIFSYQVSNTGNAQAGAHFAGIMVDQLVDETHYSNWDYVGALSAGQFQQAINSISTVGLSLGQHTLYIREDYWYNGVNESNETDNVRSLTFNVTL